MDVRFSPVSGNRYARGEFRSVRTPAAAGGWIMHGCASLSSAAKCDWSELCSLRKAATKKKKEQVKCFPADSCCHRDVDVENYAASAKWLRMLLTVIYKEKLIHFFHESIAFTSSSKHRNSTTHDGWECDIDRCGLTAPRKMIGFSDFAPRAFE